MARRSAQYYIAKFMHEIFDFYYVSETDNNLIDKDADDRSSGSEFSATGDHSVSSSSSKGGKKYYLIQITVLVYIRTPK